MKRPFCFVYVHKSNYLFNRSREDYALFIRLVVNRFKVKIMLLE